MKYKKLKVSIVIIFSCVLLPLPSYDPGLNIYILDVGQGDSTLIASPLNHKILIDGGPDGAVIEQLDEVLPFWDRKINIVMLTHPDADHVSGIVDVVRRYDVEKILLTPASSDNNSYAALMEELADSKIERVNFTKGKALSTGDGVIITGLWPPNGSDWNNPESANELSQVAFFKYKEFSMLFTGDIDTETAQEIYGAGGFRDVDALKVPHHGSKYGLNMTQLKVLSPLISTISVGGDNRYGHPAPNTIQLLKESRSHIYRTDTHGRIHIKINSAGISVIPEET